ncbi:MAG: hypothetical protein ACREUY_08940 [Burkholderiales bacterium]
MSREIDAKEKLRKTAAEFIKIRGALQNAGTLAVVAASPRQRSRIDALNTRAAMIQKSIEGAGKMIDGARHWFSDTFGTDVEDSVPLANPAIEASVQTSIAAMNYFLRDARAELNAVIDRQKKFEAIPEEKRASALSGLAAESATEQVTPAFTPSKNILMIGLYALALFLFLRGKNHAE